MLLAVCLSVLSICLLFLWMDSQRQVAISDEGEMEGRSRDNLRHSPTAPSATFSRTLVQTLRNHQPVITTSLIAKMTGLPSFSLG